MLEKIKKNQRIIILGVIACAVALSAITMIIWGGPPITDVGNSYGGTQKEEPKKIEADTTYHVGDITSVERIVHEGEVKYEGEVINTFLQSGTVLMQDGAWGGIHEFNYKEVVDIKTSEIEIRAVLTTTGELIALRDLNNHQQGKFTNHYKIIDVHDASGANTYHQIYDQPCDALPAYIYDFLGDNGRLDVCV